MEKDIEKQIAELNATPVTVLPVRGYRVDDTPADIISGVSLIGSVVRAVDYATPTQMGVELSKYVPDAEIRYIT